MMPQIKSLTGLRFIAAFYVFLFHIHIRFPLTDNLYLKNFLDQGAIGMSLFFVLSGFVLAYQYEINIDIKKYFINRFARIYPIYFLTAILTLPWIGIDFSNGHLGYGIFQAFFLVTSNIFLIQAWFPHFFGLWNNGGSWSISVEVFFYILLPFLLPKLVILKKPALMSVYFLIILLSILPGVSAYLFQNPLNNIFYSLPIYRLPEFLIGICLYLIHKKEIIKVQNMALVNFIFFVFIFYLSIFGSLMPLYIGHNFITIPVISILILTITSGKKNILNEFLSNKIMVFLGKISYCFYSFQVLLILLLIDTHELLTNKYIWLSNNKFLLACAFTILLITSAVGFISIEEPARNVIRKYGYKKFLKNQPS